MRLRAYYVSEISLLQSEAIRLLALNAERSLTFSDFERFVSKLSELNSFLTNKELDFYFAKK